MVISRVPDDDKDDITIYVWWTHIEIYANGTLNHAHPDEDEDEEFGSAVSTVEFE